MMQNIPMVTNDAKYTHGYYGRQIGNCVQAFEW